MFMKKSVNKIIGIVNTVPEIKNNAKTSLNGITE